MGKPDKEGPQSTGSVPRDPVDHKESRSPVVKSSIHSKGSTRHIVSDEHFIDCLAFDFGLDHYSLRKAFLGVPVPKKEAIGVCDWAVEKAHEDMPEASRILRMWAKKNKKGYYTQGCRCTPPLPGG